MVFCSSYYSKLVEEYFNYNCIQSHNVINIFLTSPVQYVNRDLIGGRLFKKKIKSASTVQAKHLDFCCIFVSFIH